jgi:hypothetical protein
MRAMNLKDISESLVPHVPYHSLPWLLKDSNPSERPFRLFDSGSIMHMTGSGSKDLLKFLQRLLRLVANSLRRPILLLVNLFRRVCGVRSSTAGRSMKPRNIAASHVPSISVTTDPDPAGISTLASQSSIAAAGQTLPPLASALLPNRTTGRDRSKSANSGYSSDSSIVGYPPGNGNGGSTITPPHMPMPTSTIPGNNMYRPSPASGYPPSSAAPSMTTGLSHGRGKTSARCRELVPFGASQVNRYDREILMYVNISLPSSRVTCLTTFW